MRNLFKAGFVFVLLAVVAVPFASAQQQLNTGGRCTHEANVYDTGGGISIVDFLSNTTIPDETLAFSTFEYNLTLLAASGLQAGLSEEEVTEQLTELFDGDFDEAAISLLSNGFYDGLMFRTNDIGVFHSNNGTPFNLSDDYVTVSVRAFTNKVEGINNSIACLFLFDYADMPNLEPSDLKVYEQYEDGTAVEIWFNAGS